QAADGDPAFALEFHGQRRAGGVERLTADRHTDREIPARPGEIAAPLVAAPVKQDLDEAYAAPELSRLVAIGGEEHILRLHRAGDADADRLLAETGWIGAQAARPLQGDCLGIEGAGEHHAAIERTQRIRIARERRQGTGGTTLGVEKLAIRDL